MVKLPHKVALFPDTAKYVQTQIPQLFDKISPMFVPPKRDTNLNDEIEPFMGHKNPL